MLGKTLDDRYRIERLLGSGGMGAVYAADDLRTGQKVAVKVIHANLHDSKALVQRFEREARAAGSIDTDHIARCFDAGTDPETGSPYMVLEYLVGEDLHHVIKRLGPLPPELALRITAQACLGVAKAHEANIVHRDIKPANIFLARGASSGARTVKVLDFGVAKIRKDPSDIGGESTSGGLTRTGSLLGSPLYMSPEQARSVKNIDHRSDIWSLGVVLFQAVAGRTPYEEISGLGDLILALCSDLPPPVQEFAPWISPEVAAAIDHALRLDPEERFASAAEMAAALTALVPGGIAIDDSMLVALDDQTHERIAPAFARREGSASMMPRMPTWRAHSPAAFAGTMVSEAGLSPAGAPRPPPQTAEQQSTQNAVATTGSRLPDTGDRRAPPAPQRTVPMVAVAVACVLAGGAGVYAFTRAPPAPQVAQLATALAAPPATAPTSAPPLPSTTASAAETTATPVVVGVTPTPPAPSSGDAAAVHDGGSPLSAAKPFPTPSGALHGHLATQTPTTVATAMATTTATPPPATTVRPLDHTSFGDRK